MSDISTQRIDFNRVLVIADKLSGQRSESLLWLMRPLQSFNGQTPEGLVRAGRAEDVIAYLHSISNGFVG